MSLFSLLAHKVFSRYQNRKTDSREDPHGTEMSWNVCNRIVLVTGATGVIGSAVASRLVAAGAQVIVTSRSDDGMNKLAAASPPFAGAFKCDDFSSDQACEKCIKDAVDIGGARKLDLFIHCAGATLNKLCMRTTDADLRAMFEINAVAPILLAKHAVRHGGMLARKDGSTCIAVGSIVGEEGNAGQVAYAAAKGAVASAWRSMAREYSTKNVRFNVVSPGLVDSDMSRALTAEQVENLAKRSQHGRLTTAEEVADAVLACCQDASMNGQVVRV